MSFGLGYFENGIWVDHSISDGPSAPGSADASPSGGVSLDAVHRWYGCCVESTAAQPSLSEKLGIVGEPDRRTAVAARSDSPIPSVVALMPVPSVRAVEK